MRADPGGEAVVDGLHHLRDGRMRNGRLDDHLDMQAVGLADAVDRHQRQLRAEREFRRDQRGRRGVAYEVERGAAALELVREDRHDPAAGHMREDAANAASALGKDRGAAELEVLKVDGVELGLVQRPIDAGAGDAA
jgi:hypothetical protein